MRNIRFDIKDLKVKGYKERYGSYTVVEGVMEANLVDFGVKKEVLARLEFKKDNNSRGYTVKMNKLRKNEFGNLVIYLNMFMEYAWGCFS